MANNLSRASKLILDKCKPLIWHSPKTYSSFILKANTDEGNNRYNTRSYSQGNLEDSRESVGSVLTKTTQLLEELSVPEPAASSRFLVSHVLGLKNHRACLQHQDEILTQEQSDQLNKLVACRMARMPIQYIIGDWDFREISLQVRPPVFIPRPETEQLVQIVLDDIPNDRKCHLLEIGPGSGNICLSLLYENKNIHMTALERSKMAAQLTSENAQILGLSDRLRIYECKVEGNTELPEDIKDQKFDALVSNPPYVLRKDLTNLNPEISLYEDLRALDGGARGLDVILDILKLADEVLVPDGLVYLEVDPCHPHILPEQLIKQCIPFKITKVLKDFQDKERFLVLSNDKNA